MATTTFDTSQRTEASTREVHLVSPLDEGGTTGSPETPSPTVPSPLSDDSSEEATDASTPSSLRSWAERQRRRAIGRALVGDLPLIILSYVSSKGAVSVDDLLEHGPKAELFEVIFDLYDSGLLAREGKQLRATTEAHRVLNRLNLAKS